MQLNVQVENSSKVSRKLTVRVPATVVNERIQKSLVQLQAQSNLKGFRPGQAPITVIKQHYGSDVKHRVYHDLVEDSLNQALKENSIQAIGSPKIESPEHQHGEGAHDHGVQEDKDLTYIATVEVMPEVEVKSFAGIALTQEDKPVTDEDVEKVVTGIVDSHAELIPASAGLVGADGSATSRPIRKGDHVDVAFDGGVVTDSGVEKREGMKGSRVIEIGSGALIPGFEENLEGMRSGESKTFRIPFPKDYFETTLAGKEAEFSVSVNEVKEKKLPELNDDFAKQLGHDSVSALKAKAREILAEERKEQAERKLRSDLLDALIQKNPFDCPQALIDSQMRALAQDLGEELKRQGADDNLIQQMIMSDLESLKKKAESQVRASLLLDAIAKKESVSVSHEEIDLEMERLAKSMQVEVTKLKEFYEKNPARKDDLDFRVRQEKTVALVLSKAKVKTA